MERLIPFLGIDLGTTNSVAATIDTDGLPLVLRNPLGAELMPSVVSFTPGGAVVGAAAEQLAPVAPELTVALVKRLMGTDRLFEFHGVEHTPESISALILRAIVDGVAPDRAAAPLPVVVTVPAHFGIREREATQQAALLAGLEVLELAGEPVAAAALHHQAMARGAMAGNVVVYDLGGGTFDATVLRVDGAGAQVVAVDGDTDLGGADWDARLRSHLAERFIELTGADDDPTDDLGFMTELTARAERVKRALTSTRTHQVAIRHGGRTARVAVTRAEFEAMTRDLTASTIDVIRRLLRDAGLTPDEVTDYLLVGGSTRMPMIAETVAAELGRRPRWHEPELAVAKGAALRAAQLTRTGPAWVTPGWAPEAAVPPPAEATAEQRVIPFLSSVVPRSFGLLIHDSADPDGRRRYVEHVIHRNDPLPAAGSALTVATILDDQSTVRMEVFEQAGFVASPEVADNRRVLDGELTGLPAGLPAGSPLEVRLCLGLDGRLSITAREPRSGIELRLEAYVDGVLDTAARVHQAQRLAGLTVRQ